MSRCRYYAIATPEHGPVIGSYSSLTLTIPARWEDMLSGMLDECGSLGCQMTGDHPITVVAYFDEECDVDDVERLIRVRFGELEVAPESFNISRGTIVPEDWEAQWRRTLSPIRIGKSWLVRPSWQTSDAFDRHTLVIDPKMAFGTGTHATTHLCLLELEDMVSSGMSVLDVGTGTGILAIAAAILGARPVIGVEIDPVAMKCACENLALNGQEDAVELVIGTIADLEHGPFDLISANVEFRTLSNIAPDLRDLLQPQGHIVLSGILNIEADAFVERIKRAGLLPRRMRRRYDPTTDDRWVCVVAAVA